MRESGKGVGEEPKGGESLVLYKVFNTLWFISSVDRTQKRYSKVQKQIDYFNIVLKAECESIKSFKNIKFWFCAVYILSKKDGRGERNKYPHFSCNSSGHLRSWSELFMV